MKDIPKTSVPADARFGKQSRLLTRADFQSVFGARNSAADDLVVVYGRPSALPRCRLGLSVSRKVGGAVVRNRWKRLLREAFRLSQHELPAGLDLVVIPRATAPPTLSALQASLLQLAQRISKRAQRRARGADA